MALQHSIEVPADDAQTAATPFWLKILRLFGRPRGLTHDQRRMLRVVGVANLFSNYTLALMALALPQIQVGLGVAEADVGGITAFVQLGVIPAVLLSVLADHIGRRRLLLVTILGFTVCTGLTGLVRTPHEFVALQLLARIFIAGQAILSVVVIAEEFDADTRGWGIGVLGALGGLGHGLASLVFSSINILPFGWRALFVFGGLPLTLAVWFRRTLHETRRFTAHRATQQTPFGMAALLQPFRNLARMYPGRMIAVCGALFPVAFVVETAVMFQAKFLQDTHHYSPGNVALLYMTVGALVPVGNVVAGGLGDRFGRKRMIILALVLNAAAIGLFYNSHGLWVPVGWGFMMVTLTIILVLFSALGSELFPTSYRSTASGVRSIIATAGGAAGLALEGVLYHFTGSHAAAITWMLVATPIAPLVTALFLPETASRELEDISPEMVL